MGRPLKAARGSETTLLDLIERIPLPIAMLDGDGDARAVNQRFKRTYRADILREKEMQDVIRRPGGEWRTLELCDSGGAQRLMRAQTIQFDDGPMLILDEATDTALLQRLDTMQEQISDLKRLVVTDPLTGAWNRNHFERVVAAERERSMRYRQPVSLLFLDVDHFKLVNDRYGHHAGDSVLRELVRVVRATIRSMDGLFRWGGEEFVVLAASTGYRASAHLAERIRAAVASHVFPEAGSVRVSIGVAEHFAPETVDMWFERLDKALYDAKNGGRDSVRVDERGSSDSWAAASGRSVVRLVWQEGYECGEPEIDNQHRQLFALANECLDASFGSSPTPKPLEATVDNLISHIAKHFAYEESVLRSKGYAGLATHMQAHAALLAQAGELKAAVAAGRASSGELVDFIASKVVAQHMFTTDRKFFPLFHLR